MAEAVNAFPMASGLSAARGQLNPVLVLLFLMAGLSAEAHRLDEYLQAARLRIGHTNLVLELDLTPGLQTATGILSLIDIDKDGHISVPEEEGYAGLVLSALTLELDKKPQQLRILDHEFPSQEALLQGLGTIHLTLGISYRPLASGSHHIHLVNRHRNDIGVYLVNALIPDERGIEITRQERDLLQRDYRVHFTARRTRSLPHSKGERPEARPPAEALKK